MEGQEFILFGTTHLAGLALIFVVMVAFPKITNKYFPSKKELIGRVIAYLALFHTFFRLTVIFILLLIPTTGEKYFRCICVTFH